MGQDKKVHDCITHHIVNPKRKTYIFWSKGLEAAKRLENQPRAVAICSRLKSSSVYQLLLVILQRYQQEQKETNHVSHKFRFSGTMCSTGHRCYLFNTKNGAQVCKVASRCGTFSCDSYNPRAVLLVGWHALSNRRSM